MKKRYYFIIAVIAYLIVLIVTIPVKPVSQLLSDNTLLSLQGVSGTLWRGKVSRISINNQIQLDDTTWDFSVWKILTGKLSIELDTHFHENNITSELGTSFSGRFFIKNLIARLPANELAQLANIPLIQISGEISVAIEHAHWQQGELPEATGNIDWTNASVTVADTASLGNISITLGESEKQLLTAEIKNQGGDIKIDGTAELIPEADYSINIKLLPTASASDNIKQSISYFAEKQTNGEYLLTRTGPLNQIGLI